MPESPLVTRGQICRGFGSLEQWDDRIPVDLLSETVRGWLKLVGGEQISLADIQSWDP